MAYRSLPRPSSPRDAKASIVRPYTLGKKLLASRYVAILFDSRLAFQGSKNGAEVVGLTGVEPVTSSLSGTRSNQLSYTPSSVLSSPMFGGGSRTRTGDIRLAKPTLYQLSYAPVETHSDAPGLAVAGGRGDTRQHFFLCGKSILNIWEMREASLAHPVSSGRALRAQRRIDHRNSHC